MKKEFMNDWLFHYNPYTEVWSAFYRQDMVSYFNGEKPQSLLQSNKHATLLELISKGEGDPKKIKKLING